MNKLTIDQTDYTYHVKSKAVRAFEKSTGTSLFRITKDTMEKAQFSDFFDFILNCCEDLAEEVLEEKSIEDVLEYFFIIVQGKKQNASPVTVSETSEDSHTTMELNQENGHTIKLPLPEETTSQNLSSIATSEEEREKILSEL